MASRRPRGATHPGQLSFDDLTGDLDDPTPPPGPDTVRDIPPVPEPESAAVLDQDVEAAAGPASTATAAPDIPPIPVEPAPAAPAPVPAGPVESGTGAERLAGALQVLAGACDFARRADQVGFNAADAHLGHMYAAIDPAVWTEEMTGYAYLLARRYRSQLTRAGFDLDDLSMPASAQEILAAEAEQRRAAQAELRAAARTQVANLRARQLITEKSYVACDGLDEPVVLSFPYNRALVDEARHITGRRYEEFYGHHSKVNVYPFTSLPEVMAFAARHELTVPAEVTVLSALAQARAAEEAAAPDVTVHDGRLLVRTGIDDPVNDQLRAYNGDRSTWDRSRARHIPPVHYDPGGLRALLTDAGLSLSDEAHALLDTEQARQQSTRAAATAITADPIPIPGLAAGEQLLAQQFPTVRFALTHRRILLGDDMGWGKTLSSLAAVAVDGAWPAVVVCRPSLTLNWEREISRFFPDRRVFLAEGTRPAPIPTNTDVVIIGTAALSALDKGASTKQAPVFGWVRQLHELPVRAVIVDEGQDVKERTARRTQAALALTGPVVDRDGLVLDLSGTPLVNRPAELLTQLTMIGRIEEFGGPGRFLRRYCEGQKSDHGTRWDGAHHLIELHDRLHAWGIMVRRADPAALGLPPITQHEQRLPVDQLDPQVMAAYRVAHRNAAERLASLAQTTADELGVPVLDDQVRAKLKFSAHHLAMINELRQLVGEAKRPWVTAWIDTQVAAGEKVMVAAHHREEVDAYARRFGGLRIQGGQPTAAKEAHKARFQTEPVTAAPVIAVAITAGGVGHTLTAARLGIQAEWPWTPGDTAQMAKRLHRIGQRRPVDYHVTVAEGTVDVWIADLVGAKKLTLDAVLDGQLDHSPEPADETAVAAEVGWRLIAEGLTPAPAPPIPSPAAPAPAPDVQAAPAPAPRPQTRREGIEAWQAKRRQERAELLRRMASLDPDSPAFATLNARGADLVGTRGWNDWTAAVSLLRIRARNAHEPLTGRLTDLPATDPRVAALTGLRRAHLDEARAELAARDAEEAYYDQEAAAGRDAPQTQQAHQALTAAREQLSTAHRATGRAEQAVLGDGPMSAQLLADEAELDRLTVRYQAAARAHVAAERAARWEQGPDPVTTTALPPTAGPDGPVGTALHLLGPAAHTLPRVAGQPLDVDTRARVDHALWQATEQLLDAEQARDTNPDSYHNRTPATAVDRARAVVREIGTFTRRSHTHPADQAALKAAAGRAALHYADTHRARAHDRADHDASPTARQALTDAEQMYTATAAQAQPLLNPPDVARPATAFGPMTLEERRAHDQQLATLSGHLFDEYATYVAAILPPADQTRWETHVAALRRDRAPISRTDHAQMVAEDRRLAAAVDAAPDDTTRTAARIRFEEHREAIYSQTGGRGRVHPAARRWRDAVAATDTARAARRLGADTLIPDIAATAEPSPSHPHRAAVPSGAPSPTSPARGGPLLVPRTATSSTPARAYPAR